MVTLPHAHRAVVDVEKLRDYVLSPDHEHGRHKARVFLSLWASTGTVGNTCASRSSPAWWMAEVSAVRTGRYGLRYSVPMHIVNVP
jgi:hypothetical protein